MKKVIRLIIILLCLVVLAFSLYKIFIWMQENKRSEENLNQINEITNVQEVEDNDKTEIIESKEEETSPYWTFIKMKLIDVDLNELKEKNKDTIGWIQIGGTNINYPFVQTNNNDYYLTHSFDNTYNSAGWIFLDYRNNNNLSNKNSILYGHDRYNNTMFGDLRNILNNGWLNNINNHIIKISTPNENSLWQVFSVYHIKTTSDYLETSFDNDTEYQNFLNMISTRTNHNFNTTINTKDRIITLSTCYNDDERIVLHAKLIKREVKE